MKLPVFDLHCDTALELLGGEGKPKGALRKNNGHIDLERAKELGGYAQCFAMFTFPGFEERLHRPVTEVFDEMVANLLCQLAENSDLIAQARNTIEINENLSQGKMSAILTLEGPAGIGFDPARLEELYEMGFRISTLGWNEKNPLVGSHVTGGGLTDQGREYVRECQRLGILVDVSHISDEGFWDIMDITQAPIIASHSNSRAVYGHSRNLTDDMFRAICQSGGTAGMNLYAAFLGERDVTLDTVCDHIFHLLELDGTGSHVSLGGDLDGCEALPEGFTGINSYNALSDRLLARGLDEKTIRDIYWHNTMGVMDRAVWVNQK